MRKKFLIVTLILMLSIGLNLVSFAQSKVGNNCPSKLNIWVSDVADACGTWKGTGQITIFDCNGILHWPCGRYLASDGNWKLVPDGKYRHLPFKCGHLEVEVPPGCYWVIAGHVSPGHAFIHLNYTTHVGIVQVSCGETSCVKLYNPSVRLCWNWFRHGLRMLTIPRSKASIDSKKVEELERLVEELLKDVPRLPIEQEIEGVFKELLKSAMEQHKEKSSDLASK